MSYRPIQRLIFTLLMNHENYHHGRRSRGGPGIRTPHFMTVWGPHAGGPPLFGCIHKIFYCRFDKNARKCYITRRVKHCRDSKWCHELVQLMVTSSNDIKIMTSFTYLFECNADTLAVVRNIVSTIKTESCQFGFVVDGTQRVKTELGLNRSQSKRIQTDSSLLFKRSSVSSTINHKTKLVEDLRAQTYDGAGNMSGKCNGCQAIISSEQRTTCIMFFHCSAHCANLIVQHTAATNQFVSNPLKLVQDLGALYSR